MSRIKLARIGHMMQNRIIEGDLHNAIRLSKEYTNVLEGMYLKKELGGRKERIRAAVHAWWGNEDPFAITVSIPTRGQFMAGRSED